MASDGCTILANVNTDISKTCICVDETACRVFMSPLQIIDRTVAYAGCNVLKVALVDVVAANCIIAFMAAYIEDTIVAHAVSSSGNSEFIMKA